jgi:N-acetylneuraminic acid mutarotase
MKKLLLSFFGLVLMVLTQVSANAQWSDLPKLPVQLQWPMTAQLNGKFYVFGGVNTAGSKNVYVYTPGDTGWTKLAATMPKAKFAGYAAAVNGKIYIVGGAITSGSSYVVENSTYEFDPVAGTFATKAPILAKLAFFAGAEVGGKIFVIGGATGISYQLTDSSLIQVYDPVADTWVRSASEPPSNARFAASAVLNGGVFIMGGLKTGYYTEEAWRGTVNGTDISWEAVANLPYQFAMASAGSANGKVILTGGEGQTLPSAYSNTYVYNEASDKWDNSYGLPIQNSRCGQMFAIGNDLYVTGGVSSSLRTFKLTVSDTKQPAANIDVTNTLVNLSQNDNRVLTFSAENLGIATLTVNIATNDNNKGWLSTTTPSISVNPLESEYFSLSVNSGSLAPGLYKGTVDLTTNDPNHSKISFEVALYVLPDNIKPQKTKVVLEEGTGDWCGYCPQGHEVAQGIKDQYGDDFLILNYHGGSSTEPYMVPAGQRLINDLKIQGYPNAAIQRWYFPGETYQMTNRGSWPTYVDDVFNETPVAPIAISLLEYSFDKSTGKVHAKVQFERSFATYVDASSTVRLTTVVSEDHFIAPQEDYRTPSPYWINDYEHNDIVRQILPNEFGTTMDFGQGTITDGVIAPGDKATLNVDFTISDSISDVNNCNITFIGNVIVGSSTFGSILQAQQFPLVGTSAVKTSNGAKTLSLGNYPNPALSSTKIIYSLTDRSPVTLAVFDVMGREVARLVSGEMQDAGSYEADLNVTKLPSGSYTYKLTAGEQTMSRTLTVAK